MNTNLVSTKKRLLVFTQLLLLFFVGNLYAQCPTVLDPSPTICDGKGYTFADLSADYATDNGGGVAWYDVSTGGSLISSTNLLQAGTYYIDASDGSTCSPRPSIDVSYQVTSPSGSLEDIYCSNENATIQTFISAILAPHIPVGGSVDIYYDLALNNLANTADPISSGGVNYYIVFNDGGGCSSQVKIGSTAIFPGPADPTPASLQSFCSGDNPTIADLDPGTISTHSWYSSIDGFGNPSILLASSTPLINGETYYVQINGGLCKSNTVPVNVTINNPFNPGTPTPLDYCEGDVLPANIDLFDQLAGPKDTNGVWTNDAGLTTTNGHLGTVDLSTLTSAGSYLFTYTVPQNGACPATSADIVISITDAPESGTVSPPVNFCSADITAGQTFDLFDLLTGEDSGGTWSDDNATGALTDNILNTNLLAPGTYNFTYDVDAIGSCDDVDVTVQINIISAPNSGTVNQPQTFCESDITTGQTFNLFDQLTGEDSGGTWIDDNASGALIGNLVDLSALPIGTYNFTYTVIEPVTACSGSSTITLVKQIGPPPGIDASIHVCNENLVSAAELFAALGNTTIAGGTWSPTVAGADTYTYSLGNGFCGDTYRVAVTFNSDLSCVPDVDVIIRIEAPDVIAPGQTVTITIYYSATTTREIQLFLEFLSSAKNASTKVSSGSYVLEDLRTVEAGRGSYTVSFTAPELANGVDSYRWGTYMTTVGGGTDGMIGSMTTVDNVDVDDTLGFTDVELNNSFSIYPNPTQTIFNIEVPEAGTVDLMSLNGKVLMSTKVEASGNTTLNVENLNAGVYFCRYTNSKTVKTMKLVKM